MSRIIYLILTVVAVIAVVSMMFPVLVVVLALGLIYTIVERYKMTKSLKEQEKVYNEVFENTEPRKANLEVIEAEFEEKK